MNQSISKAHCCQFLIIFQFSFDWAWKIDDLTAATICNLLSFSWNKIQINLCRRKRSNKLALEWQNGNLILHESNWGAGGLRVGCIQFHEKQSQMTWCYIESDRRDTWISGKVTVTRGMNLVILWTSLWSHLNVGLEGSWNLGIFLKRTWPT